MAATFIHTADWQLGKPFARVADPAKRAQLQNERFECLKRIARAVQDRQASFVLVAGDLFDSPSPLNTTVAKACEAIGQMRVPVLVIPGNHDHGGPGSLWDQKFFLSQREQLAPNLRVLLQHDPVILETAIVFPAPLLRRHELGDPTAGLRGVFECTQLPPTLPRIVIAHGSVQGFDSSQDEEDETPHGLNRIDLSRLPDPEIDFIALGDWHGTKQVGPKAWYAGTPEIDRFPKGPDNRPGNILVVTAGRGKPPQIETLTTGGLRWNSFTHRFSEDVGFDAFQSALEESIGNWGQDSLLKLTLEGSLGIGTSQRLADLIQSLDARLVRLKLEDRTTIAPTDEEVHALADRPADPLISSVAQQLLAMTHGGDAEIARLALRELHAALD